MSSDSSKRALPSAPSSSSQPQSPADSYIGSFISLTSKFEIRYEGVLYYLNPQDSTLGLQDVRSFGTEERKKDGPAIPPSDKVYEYILFRGSDIKDLQVKSSPSLKTDKPVDTDPAIIQSKCIVGTSDSSKSLPGEGSSLTEYNFYPQTSPSLTTNTYPGILPSHQSWVQVGLCGPKATQNVYQSSFVMPVDGQGHSGPLSTISTSPHKPIASPADPSPSAVRNPLEPPALQMAMNNGFSNSSGIVTSVPIPTTTNSVHFNIRPTLIPQKSSISPVLTSVLSGNSSASCLPAVPTANGINNMMSFPSSSQDVDLTEPHIVCKVGSNHIPVLPGQPLPFSASSVPDHASGPMFKKTPILLTPDHLAQPRLSAHLSMRRPPVDLKEIVPLSSLSSNSSSVTTLDVQEALVQLPSAAPQFSEEFDFVAMNEKFKKDEVWGHLGMTRQNNKTVETDDFEAAQSTGGNDCCALPLRVDSNPAYNKDEFFDTISCNSHTRGSRNGQNPFSERMRLDNETFGTFQQRNYSGYDGFGFGAGKIRGSPYHWGRGYNRGNYGGRSRGEYTREW